MLQKCLLHFCNRRDKYKTKFQGYLSKESLSHNDFTNVLKKLGDYLMISDSTEDVAECFPQFLLVILSTKIEIDSAQIHSPCHHKQECVVLGKLINLHPDILSFALRYFEKYPAPFVKTNDDQQPPNKRSKPRKSLTNDDKEPTDYEIVITTLNILKAAPNHFRNKWKWSPFYKYLSHNDKKVQWYALKSIGIILNMSEGLLVSCANAIITDFDRFTIDKQIDNKHSIYISEDDTTKEVELAVETSDSLVSISGILLPVFNKKNNLDLTEGLISVPSMELNLRCLALAVAARKCVCLQGPVGCGKTAMVEYIAKMTGRSSTDIIKVQLGDQTDSKMLLGSYRCTDIPGEFVWQPGVLTQAIMDDKWLLLEDIDSAALDVASVLSNLMETRTLSVPGYRDIIYAKSGFQLFVTQRLIKTVSGLHKQSTGASNLLEKHWVCVHMDPLSKGELVTIVKTLFPPLETIATRMIDVFMLFSMGNHDDDDDLEDNKFLKTGRLTSTRDLIKWCTRSIVDFDVSSPDSGLKVFQDAIDIFCCSVTDQTLRLELAIAIGNTLGIVKTKADYFINTYKPEIKYDQNIFIAGRAKVARKKSRYVKYDNDKKINFSFTRPSSVLLERVTSCVAQKEPVLLVGETGTGKTSSVQYLASCTGHKLIVINMNQQSESADLLGGYKPVDIKLLITPVREEFEILFRSYYEIEVNREFLDLISNCYKTCKWKSLIALMRHSATAAVNRLNGKTTTTKSSNNNNNKSKKRILENNTDNKKKPTNDAEMIVKWEKMLIKLEKFQLQIKNECSLAFAFIEGSLITALKEGHWVLLDEINLASSETLECLSGLLEGSTGSLSLLERGDNKSITRHPDFTMFACMNPATDVGKKELPVGLRNRFTEFYVDELTEENDLYLLVNSYLNDLNLPVKKIEKIVKFYLSVKKLAKDYLNDGTGHKPHYSLRTLCRALKIASTNPCGSVMRSLYEAFCLSFLTQLDRSSYPEVEKKIIDTILDVKTMKAVISSKITKPQCANGDDYINFQGYWVIRGTLEPNTPDNYVLTSSVCRNLKDLVRVVSIGKMPVLLQGDTSVGKTSLITYLAKASGHICLRINNHEHTDLQEYVGNYVADESGKLIFKEGVLVEAMRKGHWIILDELNLAPSDVLEALNRVLDDNRELFIPETQQTIKAHNNFMLFATQNPPGLYGGRKVLSRAFRNRFVELHFDEIPSKELTTILHERCKLSKRDAEKIVDVMGELTRRRKSTSTFAGKQGFMTLRDLFRWGERYRLAKDDGKLYDWNQHLADEGYLVLSAKVRKPEECQEIRQVIEKYFKCSVDPSRLFTLNENTSPITRPILEALLNNNNDDNNYVDKFKHVVWTYHMRKMAVLVAKSCQFKEPVLLVGETGCGKTTVCQLAAALNKRKLYSVNCHMHTESSDFLGNLRPVRNHTDKNKQKLFEWVDGPLITAMRTGNHFLADEISLADDSVLERMNSLLEPERCLLLAEKTNDSINSNDMDNNIIKAHDDFCFIGTMNPGGDYGKKELSPALRNRFTEIWCEECLADDDLQSIIVHNLNSKIQDDNEKIAKCILKFIHWLKESEIGKRFTVSIRDIMTWVNFINACDGNLQTKLNIGDAYFHGACLTYIDSLGSGSTGAENISKLQEFRKLSIEYLQLQSAELSSDNQMIIETEYKQDNDNTFGIEPFYIPRGPNDKINMDSFTFTAPTTKSNIHKVLRALQLKKPLLLEGSPGVGKTSLVSAIAKASGNNLLRINLSDQTDISDLFGADLPLEGGQGGQFAWKDGPFLRALRAGDWILLDELNLASQSVLEGLNACFDHRGEIYIPELGRSFTVKHGTKLFGCQNPLRQGGARRGLPKSFLNRFTQVFIDALSHDDLKIISKSQFTNFNDELINKIVLFNSIISNEAGIVWGHNGSPWEMNLRDIIRLCELINASMNKLSIEDNLNSAMELIYVDRMRNFDDKEKVRSIFHQIFDNITFDIKQPVMFLSDEYLYFDNVTLPRTQNSFKIDDNLLVMRNQLPILKSLANCIDMNWMPILIGGSGAGKTSVVHVLAQLCGQKLRSVVVNSAMDTTEILGGFEQTDYNRHLEELINNTENLLIEFMRINVNNKSSIKKVSEIHGLLEEIKNSSSSSSSDNNQSSTMAVATELFLRRTEQLLKLISSMKTLDTLHDTELTEIQDKIQHLSSVVKNEKCLNAGGKFEWVNSVLVKCLQDGTWLLLDQVNLCSPAVLDRLNGLLEPGGVLTIGERGIGSDGNIHTIKPHKNFRLFLTMDPRYGEISRAMRNRGVEIFITTNKDDQQINNLDIKSQLFSIGLTNPCHQEALLSIHQTIIDKNLTAENYGVNELFDSGFLITHQILRGFSIIEAFKMACTDVYIKSKHIQDSCVRDSLTSIIEETIQQFKTSDNDNFVIDLNSVTLKVSDLQDNSQISIIKQQQSLLMLLYKQKLLLNDFNVDKNTTKFINNYFDSSRNDDNLIDTEITKIIPYLLLNFYEKSTINDVKIRTKYLKNITNDTDFITTLNILEKEVIEFSDILENKCLPWYPLVSPINLTEKQTTISLKLSMLLYIKTMKINHDNIDKNINLNKNTITVDDYSNAINNNKLADRINIPLVTMFYPFADKLNNWILTYIKTVINHIDYKKFYDIKKSINWIKRFYQQGELVLIDKLNNDDSNKATSLLDNIEILLKVHYKWMKKIVDKTINLNDNTLSENIKLIRDIILSLLQEIDVTVYSVDDRFTKFTKIIKNNIITPLPFNSETIITNFKCLKNITNEFSTLERVDDVNFLSWKIRLILLHLDESKKLRYNLINTWQKIYNEEFNDTDIYTELIDDSESIKNQYMIGLNTHEQVTHALDVILSTQNDHKLNEIYTKIQLYPIYEYAFYMFVNKFHAITCCKINNDNTDDNSLLTNEYSLNKFIDIPSIPMNLLGVIKTIYENYQQPIKLMRLIHDLFQGLTKLSYASNAFKNPNLMINFTNINNENTDDYLINKKNTTDDDNNIIHNNSEPILILLVSKLILDTTTTSKDEFQVLGSASLGDYRAKIKQLRVLNDVLWRNSISFNSKDYGYVENDRKALIARSESYIKSVEQTGGELWEREMLNKSSTNTLPTEQKYQEEYRDPLDELKQLINQLKSNDNIEFENIKRGYSWMLLGYHQLFIFTNLEFIDPIRKKELKIQYVDEDIEDLKNIIYSVTLEGYAFGDSSTNKYDPRIVEAQKSLNELNLKKNNLTASKGFRSSTSKYQELVKEMIAFRQTVGSWKEIIEPIKNLYNMYIDAVNNCDVKSELFIENITEKIGSIELSERSLHEFSERMELKFLPNYRELVAPIVTALAELKHGSRILIDELKRLVMEINNKTNHNINAQNFIHNLVRFPTIGKGQNNLLELVELCTSQDSRYFISKTITEINSTDSLVEQFRLLKNGLHEFYNHVSLTKKLTKPLWNELNSLLQQVVILWQKKELEKEKLAKEEASLYRNKATLHAETITEEQEITMELRKIFPTHHDDDFHEIEDKHERLDTVAVEPKETNDNKDIFKNLITEEDVQEVHEIHARIVRLFAFAPWFDGPNKITKNTISRNYIDPLMQRFHTFTKIRSNVESAFTLDLSSKLYTSLNVITSIAVSSSQGESFYKENINKKPYDFYKSSNIEEIRQCLPILEKIKERVNIYLKQWPEHPTLTWIHTIIQRVCKFSILSPVSRFLTGLELLLVKMREWEENAHSGVSLCEYSNTLTQQIIDWRKLELNSWKGCLNAAFDRLKLKTSKWWFLIYAVVEAYINQSSIDTSIYNDNNNDNNDKSDEKIDAKKLIDRLEIFMRQSPLVEFQSRLDLLYTFHAHAFYFKPSNERTELIAIFWNIHNYYSQFLTDVQNKITSIKMPIEKKLKDFVKIARWNDINYWSVKETVEKTHRTLHKYIREYETGLKESVGNCLIVQPSSHQTPLTNGNSDDSISTIIHINTRDFMTPLAIVDMTFNVLKISEKSRILQLPKLLNKAKNLCNKTILNSSYPSLRTELDDFIDGYINYSIELKNKDIDKTLPKGKQKSQAKSILQEKRKGLADYFKGMTRMGFSYRRGNLDLKNRREVIVDMMVPPVDVMIGLKQLSIIEKVDKKMIKQWEGCENYYYKSLIKINSLHSTLTKAQNDLGPQNMDKCSGYSNHLMRIAHEQKKILADNFNKFLNLRQKIINLQMIDSKIVELPSLEKIRNSADDLKNKLMILQTGLEQLEVYICACPVDNPIEGNAEVFQLESVCVPAVKLMKDDDVWRIMNNLLKDSNKIVENLSQEHDRLFPATSSSVIRTSMHLSYLENTSKSLKQVRQYLVECSNKFGNDGVTDHPIWQTFQYLENNIDEWTNSFNDLTLSNENPAAPVNSDSETLCMTIEKLLETILLVIQEKYKAPLGKDEQDEEENNESNVLQTEEESENTDEREMRENLIESLKKDIVNLRLDDVNEKLDIILMIVQLFDGESLTEANKLVLQFLPLLKQYSLFAQFYLNEQIASMRTVCKHLSLQLSVFLDLVTNGFCVPKDLDLDEGEMDEDGVEQKSNKGGMGLGDGEGEKDVSDQIETEDQLDDARPAGEEKDKDDDKDCDEEENGIEMSENFDSKLQDMPKNEDDEDNDKDDDNDDEDLDKEMDKTEEGVDQLDEELWGDDEDEDIDETADSDEKGKGEETGDKEMTSNEEVNDKKKENNDEDDNQNDGNEEKEKPEINEMNEPDENDDQINPHHGKQELPPEPEEMDLPDDLNLDNDDEVKDGKDEENPFDIDDMKENQLPTDKDEPEKPEEEEEEKNKDNEPAEDSSDDEDDATPSGEQPCKDLDDEEEKEEENTADSEEKSINPEDKDEEKENNQENEEDKKDADDAVPSMTDTNEAANELDEPEEQTEGSRDKTSVNPNESEKQESSMTDNNYDDDGKDDGTGQAQSDDLDKGHLGTTAPKKSLQSQNKDHKQKEKRKNPGDTDDDHALAEEIQSTVKKQKMINNREETNDEKNNDTGMENDENSEIDMCQHVKDSEEYDGQVMDAATEEQQKKQQIKDIEEEKPDNDEVTDMEVDMHEDEDDENNKAPEKTPEAIEKTEKNKDKPSTSGNKKTDDTSQMETKIDVEGEIIKTMDVSRSSESAFFTKIPEYENTSMSPIEREKTRKQVEDMMSQWTRGPPDQEALTAWNCLSAVTESPARDLSEKLRLVLEPTQATRLKGDYRTGKRLNMRKIIPYIASQFRKDKIWLRRTKPSKRDYQVVLAIDDSSSMADNHSKELAFESLALITKAMGYLEVGELGVVSFGESVKILHPLGEPFNEQSGSRLIQEMQFIQKKTEIAKLVNTTVDMFENQIKSSDNAKLLIILCDGKFSEGEKSINQAVRRAKQSNIFTVFIMIESPLKENSLLNTRTFSMGADGKPVFDYYMDRFPFPFYMILKDINALPGVLSDALRQWFEIVGKIDT
ncbi:hypothetical protein HCN44_009319 [Aphidius gifuensis]|uniref:Midasin n=1 Tax=Aphidius gifuensis TaxID=684658 RepID=A0A834Y7C7_APHGI|nr:midasin [Aphidius gifuensis]KAF7997921.1 hypothetical protein HCN44_009319 [Aphidius gifuensis]